MSNNTYNMISYTNSDNEERLIKYYNTFTSKLNHYYTGCESITTIGAPKLSNINFILSGAGALPVQLNPLGFIAIAEGKMEEHYKVKHANAFLNLANGNYEFQYFTHQLATYIINTNKDYICNIYHNPKELEKLHHGHHGIDKYLYKFKGSFPITV